MLNATERVFVSFSDKKIGRSASWGDEPFSQLLEQPNNQMQMHTYEEYCWLHIIAFIF